MDELIRNLAVYALPVLFALTMHDAAQAFVARRFGDNTAHAAGRTTLNPLAHIDPVGTIVIPVVMYLMTSFVFGYAKPLPLNYGQMRHPKRDMAFVALSGPGANFVMALIWLIFGILLQYFQVDESFPNLVAKAGVQVNLWLMAFNLLPIPSMDGGRIVFSLLPQKAAYQFARLEPYGFLILLALILLKVVTIWLFFVGSIAGKLLYLIASPLILLLS
ncbi:site-2 protease family protein [Herbaspirillum sp. SJZ107]|uniref:site-2 protease family protein n=1 Tax=Herbaspirillum sp. SJZ107 TaxID=2572881 RepID=UPI0011547128|nr:site-2 protease family protein [Herbaspirillum sp. SJZ107]TQK07708.1 Zn-dependent protease [Herbaspirillum sp. SJZ107]